MIASAEQKGNQVFVRDEKGRLLFSKPGELRGYTSATVSIKLPSSNNIVTLDEKGRVKFSKPGK